MAYSEYKVVLCGCTTRYIGRALECFDENPVKEFSAQRLTYSLLYDDFEEIAPEVSKNYVKRGEDEAELLKKEMSAEALVKMMRGNCDPLNHPLLHSKILEQEETLIPMIIKKLKMSGNDVFIEHTVIKKAKKNYCEELVAIIDDIRFLMHCHWLVL